MVYSRAAGWLLGLFLMLPSAGAWACRVCRPRVQATIHDTQYLPNLALVLLPVAVLLGLGLTLYFLPALKRRLT
ncbi:hypothetical protein LJY25_14200 [Hymenobacter sp. BT175]|uniref:hypothetical protein n=1 Tax=Hymenobacter translucens TaxID=2886507 RepID=UPI001D0E5EE5|nr:hypothetical protein [Hymenobacter translucens]MCC2547605.1 hypothetical protein [Hymenobacter translucens]